MIFAVLILANVLASSMAIFVGGLKSDASSQIYPRDEADVGGVFVAVDDKRLPGALYKYVPMENLTEEEKRKYFTVIEKEEISVEVAPDNMMMRPRDPLIRFITKLRVFFSGDCFAVDAFESASNKLEQELANYTSLTQKVVPPETQQKKKLDFAKRMFQDMVDAIEPLKHYEFMGREDLHLVNRVIDFRLKLYNMYDFEGVPNSNRKGYKGSIRQYTIMKDFWKDRFAELEGVPIGVRSMFKTQLAQAVCVLDDLKSHQADIKKGAMKKKAQPAKE